MCPRRGRGKTLCACGAWRALLGGPSTSPLDVATMLSARSVLIAIFALAILRPVLGETPVSPLPTIDFKDTFPWKVWVSSEGHDAEYPSGFRYKLLSVRSADSQTVEFVLVREVPPGKKIIALHAKGPLARFDEAAAKLLDTFAQKFNITFQKFDLTDVHNFEEFQTRARGLGWDSDVKPK